MNSTAAGSSAAIRKGGSGLLQDPELAALFLESVQEALDGLNQGLSRLRTGPDDSAAAHAILRCAHKLKGCAGSAGFSNLSALARQMEIIVGPAERGRIPLSDQIIQTLSTAAGRIRKCIDRLRNGKMEDIAKDELRGEFAPCSSTPSHRLASVQEPRP